MLANPKCGLVNIQNHDIECFKWCMKYHQSEQSKHSHRLTELKKVKDNYNYSDISYPVACDDITIFEDNNNLMINVWKIEDNGNIFIFIKKWKRFKLSIWNDKFIINYKR